MIRDKAVLRGSEWEYWLDGRQVTEAEFEKRYPPPAPAKEGDVPGGTSTTGWPLRSNALACHPSQVDEMNERNKHRGIATRYEKDGTAVIPDPNDRRKLCKVESEVLGFPIVDRDGFM